MAAGWVHEALDLIVFGRIYRAVHQTKDAYAQQAPGRRHRDVGHEWYQQYGKLWTCSDPFPRWLRDQISAIRRTKGPDAAEERMVSDAHDFLDRRWDELAPMQRRYWGGFFIWLLYRPDLLETWAGVDVGRGRILRVINGEQVWESSPETVCQYRGLRRRVSRHQKSGLRDMLAEYG